MANELKFDDKKKKKIIEELRSFWKKYWEKENKFRREISELEKEMTDKFRLGIELEFFYVDNECTRIGASNFADRDKFPLIHDSELHDFEN